MLVLFQNYYFSIFINSKSDYFHFLITKKTISFS